MDIVPARGFDEQAIAYVIEQAFRGHPYSDGSEPAIVERLRAAGALAVSLVALEDGRVVGHVAMSPVKISTGEPGWFGLGPVSVMPGCQGRGIGTALIRAALALIADAGAAGCVVLGNPSYYTRFGFCHYAGMHLPGFPASHFMALPMAAPALPGDVRYHEAFGVK